MKLVVTYYQDRDLIIRGVEAESVEAFKAAFDEGYSAWSKYDKLADDLRSALWEEYRAKNPNYVGHNPPPFEGPANDAWQSFCESEDYCKAVLLKVGDYSFPPPDDYLTYPPEVQTLDEWFENSKPLGNRQ